MEKKIWGAGRAETGRAGNFDRTVECQVYTIYFLKLLSINYSLKIIASHQFYMLGYKERSTSQRNKNRPDLVTAS